MYEDTDLIPPPNLNEPVIQGEMNTACSDGMGGEIPISLVNAGVLPGPGKAVNVALLLQEESAEKVPATGETPAGGILLNTGMVVGHEKIVTSMKIEEAVRDQQF